MDHDHDNNAIPEIDTIIQELKDKNKLDHMLSLCSIDSNGHFTEKKTNPVIPPLLKHMDEEDARRWSFSWMPPIDTFYTHNYSLSHSNEDSYVSKDHSTPKKSYNQELIESKEFHNPFAVHNMLLFYNLSDYISLYRDLSFPENEDYKHLRNKQETKWAFQRLQVGVEYANKNDHVNAIRCYNEALNLIPNFADAYTARGASYVKQRKIKEGIEDFKQALKYNPNAPNASTYLNKAQMLLERERAPNYRSSLLPSTNSGLSSSHISKTTDPDLNSNDELYRFVKSISEIDAQSLKEQLEDSIQMEKSRSHSHSASRHHSSHRHHHHRHKHESNPPESSRRSEQSHSRFRSIRKD